MPRPQAPVVALLTPGTKREQKVSRFKPRNPLINLDSDERIQGNPTLAIGGLRSETARGQENPNGSTGPTSRPAAEKEPNRLHPKAKRPNRQRLARLNLPLVAGTLHA